MSKKYIEPSNLVEDSHINATAIGVYVALLHYSDDGKHCKNIRKKELQERLNMTDKTLNGYLNKLADNGYLSISKGYDNCFNVILKESAFNYADWFANGNKDYGFSVGIEDEPESYTIEEAFRVLFKKELTPSAIETINKSNIDQTLFNYALNGSCYNVEHFVDYDYLINYVIRVVKDWQAKHIKSIDEVKRYMRAHRNGYSFLSDLEIKRLKNDYGIVRSPQSDY